MDITRRNLIHILGIAPAAAAEQTPAWHVHAAPPAPAKKAYRRKVFDDHQWRTAQVLCDLIIPADEHSGSATAAGVPEFIDRKSTRLNSSHLVISYAVFCLEHKTQTGQS